MGTERHATCHPVKKSGDTRRPLMREDASPLYCVLPGAASVLYRLSALQKSR